MGGSISVRSQMGEGSCFTVMVPTEYLGPSLPEADAGATARANAGTGEDLHILAAEDNVTNQLVLRSLLEPLGCDLTIVGNGREAVEAFKTGAFDVILMDVQMPEMNGVEATRAIRAYEAETGSDRTPIVALSANVMSHQIEEYVESGMDHWVAKPIELAKLYAGLELVLNQAGEAEDVENAAAA
jgi:CheY-like chemotaxis protein